MDAGRDERRSDLEAPIRALITGITGQDGSYLSEFLLDKGYEVHGIVRRSSTFNTGRIDHIRKDLNLHYGDLADGSSLTRILAHVEPDEIYNLGAQSHVAVSFEMPEYTAESDALGCLRLLESMRLLGLKSKFYQASTSEMFGSSPPPQNELTPMCPRSPYGAAKLYAYWTVKNYREAYGIHACNGILFNHESGRRGENFVTRKICRTVARGERLVLGNLDAVRDWGHAKDYVRGMWMMLQSRPDDYVLATGKGHTVRDFVEACYRYVGRPVQVDVDPQYLRPLEVDALIGDASKAKENIGWEPEYSFESLVADMMEQELGLIR